MKTPKIFVEGIDYYFNEQGHWVFTQKHLLERGYCCKNGCTNCPYKYKKISKKITRPTTTK